MSIVNVADPGFGSPLRVTFRVTASDGWTAVGIAKTEAKEAGYAVKTLGRVDPVDGTDDGWDVVLVARPKA